MAIATHPRQSWTAWGTLRALETVLASMRFVATPLGRDPRLDLLRGFCVFAMIVDHIGGSSWLYALTGGNRGPITAAEGFVFLSGLVLGTLYGWIGAQTLLGQLPGGGLVPPAVPWLFIGLIVLAAAVLAVGASVAPTRRATRVAPVEALAVE